MIAGLGLAGMLGYACRAGAAALIGLLVLFSVLAAAPSHAWIPSLAGRLFDTPGKVLTMYFLAGSVWALIPGAARAWSGTTWPGLLACGLLVAAWHWGVYRWLGPWIMPPVLFWLAARLPFSAFERRVGGDYSYGLYIYGYPVLQMLAHFGAIALGYPAFLAAGFCGAGLLAAASWHWIERPALSLKNLAFPTRSGHLGATS
jgi:peptidoglycan/LPS O-acetylase OafA/YrhL